MKKINSYVMTLVLAFGFVLFTGTADLSAESSAEQVDQPVANVTIGSHGITFQPKVEYAGLVFTVSTPGGAVFSKTFDSGITPYFELSELGGNSLLDGSYTFELRVLPVIDKMARTSEGSAGFESQGLLGEEALTQNGYFSVQGGSIVTMSASQEGIAQPLDIVHLDDVIIDGSLCVGFDCVNGESFGFDTIRLKENNLRIKFQDTSSTASFPTNDWQITINDSSNGGAEKFSIDDIDNSRTPFTIEASAPSHSLYVDDGGRLGLGTSTPVVDVHVKSGNTPTLRLEQDGTSGFTPQTWDVAGNEANFFVRDATNGSQLPFKIKPGADSNSLFIASDGDIGLGTASPSAKFHINADNSAPAVYVKTNSSTGAVMKMERDAGAITKIAAANNQGQFGTENDHPLNLLQNNQTVMTITDATAGNTLLTMKDGGTYDGTWNNASSRELKENITGLALEDAMSTLEGLEPVRYNYKGSKEEEHVGFIAEDVPDMVANNGRKNLSPMDIVAVLTKVVKEQQKTISELKQEILKNNK